MKKWRKCGLIILSLATLMLAGNQAFSKEKAKIAIPPGGVWMAHGGAGKLVCPGYSKVVTPEPGKSVTLTVLDKGNKIDLKGPDITGNLTRSLTGPEGAVYQGSLTMGGRSIMVKDLLFYENREGNPEMLGEMVRQTAGGCTFTRTLFMNWLRAKVKIKNITK